MEVKIYTIPTCPWCMKTKEFLKENKIKFKDIDVALDKKAAKEIINKAARNISDKRPDIIKAERRRTPTILEIRFTTRDSKSACGYMRMMF